jgi:hypothetical protein
MRSLTAAAAIALTLCAAVPAAADDIVFNVPVRIENTRDMRAFQLTCQVSYYEGTRTVGFANVLQETPIVDGGYTGTVTVTATLDPGEQITRSGRWSCEIRLRHTDGTLSPPSNAGLWYTDKTGQEVASMNTVINTEIRP